VRRQKLDKVCRECRAGTCQIHTNPVHGLTEAEAALQLVKLGFDIVGKDGKPVTREQLEAVIERESCSKS
jgi:hypothetical protein